MVEGTNGGRTRGGNGRRNARRPSRTCVREPCCGNLAVTLMCACGLVIKDMLNGRQLALKTSANSYYGFTGAHKGGMLPCIFIAETITSLARKTTLAAIKIVNERYPKSQVVYGDTDSLMIKFDECQRAKTQREMLQITFDMGLDAATYITKHFQEKLVLVREKVYFPFLLVKKKNYAAIKYEENPDSHPE